MSPAQGQPTVKIFWEFVAVILTEDKRVAAWVFVVGPSHTWVVGEMGKGACLKNYQVSK